MGEWLLSRRDRLIVAWHEVPGKAPPEKNRPVGYGVTRAGVRIDSMIGIRVGVSQVQETVRYIEQQLDIIGHEPFKKRNSLCLRNTAHISTRNTSGISYARSYRTLRDGSFEGRFPRHFVPCYDRTVPPGHMSTATALKAEMSKLQGVGALKRRAESYSPWRQKTSQTALNSRHTQFSRVNPGTRENSTVLFVTSVASRALACAAIKRSIYPIGIPCADST